MFDGMKATSPESGSAHGIDRADRLLAAFPAAMGVLDEDLRWRLVNRALTRLLSASEAALLGQPSFGAVHEDDNPAFQQCLRALLRGDRDADTVSVRWRRGDGSVLHAEVEIGRIAEGGGGALLLQLRSSESERAARDALDNAQRQLQRVTDAISHDLRAPVRAIDSFAARLADRLATDGDATARDYLGRIRAGAARMSELLSALGEFVRATRADMRTQAVDLSLVCEWACMSVRDRYPEREAEVRIQPGLSAHGDERLLQLLVLQLVDNAWRFAREGAPVQLRIEGERLADRVRLTVHDDGVGFEMEYAHKLFEPFQRLHGPDRGGGHGLGLAIAHRVVERHGGRIWAESAPGAGTTLYVELPAEPSATERPR